MRAIICDTCGKSVPDSLNADILPIRILYGQEQKNHLERDICPVCLAKLVGFFETPEPAAKAIETPVVTQEPMPEPVVAEAPAEAAVDSQVEDPITEAVADPESQTILCAHCSTPFVPKIKTAKCCSKYCSNHKWIDDQKLKKAAASEAEKKKTTDELLARLKRENPVKRDTEPVFDRIL